MIYEQSIENEISIITKVAEINVVEINVSNSSRTESCGKCLNAGPEVCRKQASELGCLC